MNKLFTIVYEESTTMINLRNLTQIYVEGSFIKVDCGSRVHAFAYSNNAYAEWYCRRLIEAISEGEDGIEI